jgi:hypothetical protein
MRDDMTVYPSIHIRCPSSSAPPRRVSYQCALAPRPAPPLAGCARTLRRRSARHPRLTNYFLVTLLHDRRLHHRYIFVISSSHRMSPQQEMLSICMPRHAHAALCLLVCSQLQPIILAHASAARCTRHPEKSAAEAPMLWQQKNTQYEVSTHARPPLLRRPMATYPAVQAVGRGTCPAFRATLMPSSVALVSRPAAASAATSASLRRRKRACASRPATIHAPSWPAAGAAQMRLSVRLMCCSSLAAQSACAQLAIRFDLCAVQGHAGMHCVVTDEDDRPS